ncbi:MAG: PKD repeat protein [Bacteroidia bacterium]|jgi:PKD repeat protein
MTKLIKLTMTLCFAFLSRTAIQAQCNPSYSPQFACENYAISFKANAPGFSTYNWTFKEKASGTQLGASTDRDPIFNFAKAGTYTVTLKASGAPGNCIKTIEVVIKASPKIDVQRVSDTVQCFAKNEFCFTDYTKPVKKSRKQIYEFNDGVRYQVDTPSFPYTFCHRFIDPQGGSFNLKVTSIDDNGCTSVRYYDNFVRIHPHMNVRVSSNEPTGCDSTMATITNLTYLDWKRNSSTTIGLEDVAQFEWDFGGGNPKKVVGDSVTNTKYWTGEDLDGIIEQWYHNEGKFDITLSVTSRHGCEEEFTFKAAARSVSFTPGIVHNKKRIMVGEKLHLQPKNGPVSSNFLWNFGDPISGPDNFESVTRAPIHRYTSLGPKMISLRMISGPCDKTVFDTIEVVGPLAQIEAPYNRISEKERYQCKLADTVHFTNNSRFWNNDLDVTDEDSVVYVDGNKRYVFNYNETTKSGDQTALTSSAHFENRTMGNQVFRLWNLGDDYAEQCTTDTKQKVNIGKNCNYSVDELPTHKYQDWDSVYYKQHYVINDTFYNTVLANGNCKETLVDTSDKALHRFIFNKTFAHNYFATLYLKDTVNGPESIDYVEIIGTIPDASGMTISSGQFCPLNGNNLNHYLTFDLNTGGQSYFAVNFDSAQNRNNFISMNSGGILAPPAPGSPIPFVLPYDIAGALPSQFVKGYSQGELGSGNAKKTNTIGLIVGNGPLGSNGEPPACLDTAWYHNMVTYDLLHSQFTILGGKTESSICKGDTVCFKMNNEIQHSLKALRWNWGNQTELNGYYEEFKNLEKYTGPVSTRNDKDVVYNGEDWLYNYVVRHELSELYGDVVLDTIVTAIIKDYWLDYIPGLMDLLHVRPGRWVNKIPNNEIYKYIGTCIDTTGISSQFVPKEFRETPGGSVFTQNGKRYRYTDGTKKDSVIVAEILHFRDSSLQGFDTYFDGKDTIHGVWKHVYQSNEITETIGQKDTSLVNMSGAMIPSLFLSNVDDCQVVSTKLLNVGHLLHVQLVEDAACKDQIVEVYDSVRYWQLGDQTFPRDYPMDPRKFWEDPQRFVQNIETKEVDWDASEGIGNDKNRAIIFFHQYDDPGAYTITLFSKDSIGCRDTVQLTVDITGVKSNFEAIIGKSSSGDPCDRMVQFNDSTQVTTATGADSIVWYEWDFGDGSHKTIVKNPSHQFQRNGSHTIKLKTWSLLGCRDSIEKIIFIPGPQPLFEFTNHLWSTWWTSIDTATIHLKDTLFVKNTSLDPMTTPGFVFSWGDNVSNSTNDSKQIFKHNYDKTGVYYPNLYMQDTIDGSANRCFSYYPAKKDSVWLPSKSIVVIVTPDTLNSIEAFAIKAKIYPNPNFGRFSIETVDNNRISEVNLTNVFGQYIPILVVYDTENRVEVQSKSLVEGNYFLQISTDQGTITKKITITR